MSNTELLWAFLAGGMSGAVIALLYAPQSGRESRTMLLENSNNRNLTLPHTPWIS